MPVSESDRSRRPALPRVGRRAGAVLAALLVAGAPSAAGAGLAAPLGTVTVDARQAVNRVDPRSALGADLDGHERGETAQIYTPANVRRMRSAGSGSGRSWTRSAGAAAAGPAATARARSTPSVRRPARVRLTAVTRGE
jgi:hypothetical protein